jgi:pyruvate kinase
MSRLLCKYRLPIPLVSACPDSQVVKTLNMMNGVHPIKVPDFNSKILGPDHLIKILLKTSTEIVRCVPGHLMIVVRSEKEGTREERHYFTFHRIEEQ